MSLLGAGADLDGDRIRIGHALVESLPVASASLPDDPDQTTLPQAHLGAEE